MNTRSSTCFKISLYCCRWEPEPWLPGPPWDPQFCPIPYGSIIAYAAKLQLPSFPWLKRNFPVSQFLLDKRAMSLFALERADREQMVCTRSNCRALVFSVAPPSFFLTLPCISARTCCLSIYLSLCIKWQYQERELEEKRRARRRAEMAELESYHSPKPPQVQRQLVRRLEPVRTFKIIVICTC